MNTPAPDQPVPRKLNMQCTACDQVGDILLRSELSPGFEYQICKWCAAFYDSLDDKEGPEFVEYVTAKCIFDNAAPEGLPRA